MVVEGQVDLDLLAPGKLQEVVVERPPVGRDRLRVPGPVQVLIACRGQGEDVTELGLAPLVLGASRNEVAREGAETRLAGVGVLDDEPGDPVGMPRGQAEAHWRAEVERIKREAVQLERAAEALDHVGERVEAVFKRAAHGARRRGVALPEAGVVGGDLPEAHRSAV